LIENTVADSMDDIMNIFILSRGLQIDWWQLKRRFLDVITFSVFHQALFWLPKQDRQTSSSKYVFYSA